MTRCVRSAAALADTENDLRPLVLQASSHLDGRILLAFNGVRSNAGREVFVWKDDCRRQAGRGCRGGTSEERGPRLFRSAEREATSFFPQLFAPSDGLTVKTVGRRPRLMQPLELL